MAVLEKVQIVLGIKSEGFGAVSGQLKGLHSGVQRNLSDLKTAVAGYFSVAVGKQLARATFQVADHLKDVAEQAGTGTTALQKWERAWEKVGGTVDDVAAAFDMLAAKRAEALEGNGATADLFRNLGIGEDELRRLEDPNALSERVARDVDPTDPDTRATFRGLFGQKKFGKTLAAMAEYDPNASPRFDKETLDTLAQAAQSFSSAARDFVAGTAPLVAAMVNWTATALKFWGNQEDRQEAKRQLTDLFFRPDKWVAGSAGPVPDPQGFAAKSDQIREPQNAAQNAEQAEVARMRKAAAKEAAKADHYRFTKEAAKKFTDDAISSAYFTVENSSGQQSELRKRLARMRGEADEAKKDGSSEGLIKAAKIEAEMISMAGKLAGMNRTQSGMFAPDSLAAVGGIIGGAGIAADPGLNVQEDIRSILQDLLQEYKLTNNNNQHSPMDAIRPR